MLEYGKDLWQGTHPVLRAVFICHLAIFTEKVTSLVNAVVHVFGLTRAYRSLSELPGPTRAYQPLPAPTSAYQRHTSAYQRLPEACQRLPGPTSA